MEAIAERDRQLSEATEYIEWLLGCPAPLNAECVEYAFRVLGALEVFTAWDSEWAADYRDRVRAAILNRNPTRPDDDAAESIWRGVVLLTGLPSSEGDDHDDSE